MRAGIDVPLVGRHAELSAIDAVLGRAASGSRGAVVLEGEAGIGKTRLITEAATRARDLGFAVFRGTADDIEHSRPYGVILSAFDRPELREASRSADGEYVDLTPSVVDALVSIVEDEGRSAPVALLIDDLHWADTSTLRVLRALVRRTTSQPIAFIAATRPAPISAELEALIGAVGDEGAHVELGPLDDDAIRTLVDSLVAESLTPELRSRVRTASGNPFFVIEIVASGIDEIGSEEIPRDVRRAVLRRVMQLSDDARSILRIASLIGPVIDIAEVAMIAGRTTFDVARDVEEAVKARVLEDDSGSLVFRHDIVREAIYSDIPVSVRKRLHRDAGRALAGAGAGAVRVAAHFAAFAEAGDGEAIAWLRRAAAEEVQRSPTVAADVLAQAAELIDRSDPVREEVLADRVQALAWAGRVAEASTLASGVLSEVRDASLAGVVRESLGESLFFSGRVLEGGEQLVRAADECVGSGRGLLFAQAALARLMAGQIREADELTDRALADAASTTDPRAASMATGVRGVLQLIRGERDWLDVCRDAVRIADEDFLRGSNRYGARSMLAYALREADLFDESVDVLNEWIRLDDEYGISWSKPSYYAFKGGQHFDRGEWDDAIAEFETAGVLLDEMGSSFLKPAWLGVLGTIAVHRGDLERAEQEIVRGEAVLAETGPQTGAEWLILARILLAEAAGDVAGALAVADGASQLAQGMGLLLGLRYFCPVFVRLAVANGTPERAGFAVEALESFVPSLGTRSATGTALLCRGMLGSDIGRLLDAVGVLEGGARPLELAMAYEQAGLALANSGERLGAVERFNQAIGVYDTLGAQLDVARVTESLRGSGGRRRASRQRPTSGWESLSPTEHKVVTLVAEGLTNPAIAERLVVSRRTIETHISHLFRKLGVTSRVELALLASRELAGA